MGGDDFELNVRLPADARYAETLRDLAAHAARYAGCADDHAERYGATVQRVAAACLMPSGSGTDVPVILRCGSGPVEFLIGCGAEVQAASEDGRITIGWTRERGTSMCRVAIDIGAGH
jgi:hypothetical protein